MGSMRQLNPSSMRARGAPAPAFRVSRQVAGFVSRGFRECPSCVLNVRALRSGGSNLEGAGNAAKCRPPSAVAAEAVRVRWTEEPALKTQGNAIISERRIEKVIYGCRFFTLLGVSGSLIGAVLCFIKGSVCVASTFLEYFATRGKVISLLIEATDVYLIGTVMLVFGMGLYELFISNLDIAKTSANKSSLFGLFKLQERPQWLEIKSVNELKTKLGHVIVMVLLVGLFEKSKVVMITSPVDLLCFAASILLSSCGLFLLSRLKN